ncbi:tRNA (adenosine(37)-N6)-threonylcarbamoyltransferase complex ATPase subunit type 1 TsaE [Thermoflexus sp.]|uniref:tRNA (adenosine(37)-N6)-threonylcarbamoyltransferase complex ATPase subunit type 1 TsaE n=1 Tax=Thermoflexus sp. TaxID=1969742 RepID=UPI0025F096C3|nr:tRNA (adenosine(37)-N6)-threonylcarbamoyltransferase complex ATPase subunit type 1 TsaE [Thermoflexus sp.]MDW8180025.1 tRNA (adenosine(37)-N6)-threonylcarbamoyltransferase complex ATPase subunit type 1 TsaE [Anaerolineae bacterium]MCS6962870.1 tRNA (adenosine(37)-N6)-threonylcarbamoyltransferase complex ATPase subunit type 1 TsaE [Thermoflexus sp.]MCS7350574.1 tRNA (adenosine(37)-N6)-threonylcarbamoyltransferase complex ATPase subunit type 1 TsaE [Thermoflexus sp.]MCX7690709.1 tRNA (adenosin
MIAAWLLERISIDEATTRQIGATLGRWLQPGDIVAVQGPLGAGKTRFIQGIAEGLGVTEPVQSPSFILVQAYPLPGGRRFYHVDLYRLENPEAVWALGLWDLFDEMAIIAMEWPERAAGLIPEPYLRVTLIPLGDTVRQIRMEAIGSFPLERLKTLQALLGSE